MWQPDWPAIVVVLRSTMPLCHVIGTLLGIGYYARVTALRTNELCTHYSWPTKEIHVVKLCNRPAKWKHAMIVAYYVNLIVILLSHPILSWNLVTQMWNIIVKYPGTFSTLLAAITTKLWRRGKHKTIWESPGNETYCPRACFNHWYKTLHSAQCGCPPPPPSPPHPLRVKGRVRVTTINYMLNVECV